MKTNDWIGATQFALLAGINRSVASRILRDADENGKPFRDKKLTVRKATGRGPGGQKREVAVTSLPENLFQAHLAQRDIATADQAGVMQGVPEPRAVLDEDGRSSNDAQQATVDQKTDPNKVRLKQKEFNLKEFTQLPHKKRQRAEARFYILNACNQFIRQNGLSHHKGEELFVQECLRDRIVLPSDVRNFVQSICVRTLRSWFAAEREHGKLGLIDGYGKRQGRSKLDMYPEVQKFIIGMVLEKTILRPTFVYEAIQAKYPDIAKQFSPKTVERFMVRWRKENDQVYCYLTHPDRWKSEYKTAIGSQSEAISALNQLWSLDDTRADLFLTDGRYSAIFLIDIYSRRVKIRIARSVDAIEVGMLLRGAMHTWGAPQAILIDNGKPYSNAHINGALSSLEIDIRTCTPYASEEKGIVERVQGTFSKILEICPGFIGHSVSDRKRIEAKRSFAQRSSDPHETFEVKISAVELQEFANQWCDDRYQHTQHAGLPINPETGKNFTPFEIATAWRGQVRKIDERALDILLLMKSELRSVTKKGIHIDRARYWHPNLVPHIGKQVIVRIDPEDLGKAIVHSANTHIFICIAENIERSGLSLKEVAAVATATQKKFIKEEAEQYKEARKAIRREDPVKYIMQRSREAIAKITAFPHRQIPHSTPGIEAAKEAAEALQDSKTEKKKVVHQPVKAVEPDVPFLKPDVIKIKICKALRRGFKDEEIEFLNRWYPEGAREDQINTIIKQLTAPKPAQAPEPEQPVLTVVSAKKE